MDLTELYLIRHGSYITSETDWLPDPVLSPEGQVQAGRLRDRLKASDDIRADVLITSTLQRARETAEIIAPALGLPVLYDDDLQEWNNEDAPDTFAKYMEQLKITPVNHAPFLSPGPGCESWSAFMLRACAALNRVTVDHAGKRVMIVCHGGIIEASFLLFCGLSTMQFTPIILDSNYTSITHWKRMKGVLLSDRWMLERFNDTARLTT